MANNLNDLMIWLKDNKIRFSRNYEKFMLKNNVSIQPQFKTFNKVLIHITSYKDDMNDLYNEAYKRFINKGTYKLIVIKVDDIPEIIENLKRSDIENYYNIKL